MLFIGLLITTSTFALQIKSVVNNGTVNANVSQDNKTRVFVEGDRITALRGTPGAYTYVNDNVNGQVFIMPTPDFKNKPFSLFITTESGKTVGLNLTPIKSLSDSILLKPKGVASSDAARWESESDYNETIINLIRYMANGIKPEGYETSAITQSKTYYLGNIATIKLLSVYRGAHLEGVIYQLSNRLNKPITVDEREFYRPGTRAIAVQNHLIPAKGTTLVYGVISHE